MATTKFYLDLRGKAKDGKGSILITIYHNTSTSTIATGIRVLPSEWNGRSIVKVPGCEALNATLLKKKSNLDKQIALLSLDDGFEMMTATQVKRAILEDKPRRNRGHLVSDVFDEYMNSSQLKEGTKEIYRTTLKKIVDYSGDITLESINLKWLRQFEKHLSESQGVNGRAIYLRALRAICNYAVNTGILSVYPFQNFQVKQEETRKRNISVDTLRHFYSFKTTRQKAYYRDYFFLMFYFIGINVKDLLLAKKIQVSRGRFEYIREKTGKKYSIKIEPEAQELLDKYAGKGEYLLEAMDHCLHHKSFMHMMNDALKTIGTKTEEIIPNEEDLFGEPEVITKIEPIIPGITSYFARHTWATLAYELGISFDIISQALGHSFANRTTLIYVKQDQQKVDEANRKVIDYLHSTRVT